MLFFTTEQLNMGRRKLKYQERKNYERKKHNLHARILPSKLLVHLPLSAYTSSKVSDVTALHTRLEQSKMLPSLWNILQQSIPPLVLYKIQFNPSLPSVKVTFTLTVDCQCFWTLRLEASEIRSEHSQLLSGLSSKINSIDAMIDLLTTLDQSKFCVGNPDSKFTQLIEHHKRSLKTNQVTLVSLKLNLAIFKRENLATP